ncbi:hypothetical protein [Glycomyces xiaoerkulensis]|uniref:hypothetical protein n=1 Tax=Glycomyces xiaoerkulensis TaxID=2038139 RepID=UPI000C25625A|nr:hypothetical protein [Glycomyces xiaoerkulensis]
MVFSNLSPAWRRRLRAIVVAWAVLLVAAAFFASGATVREQADAAEGRTAADAAVGVAASALAGSAFPFSVGPAAATACDLTPVRGGVNFQRHFEVATDEPEAAFEQASAALAGHFGVDRPGRSGHWRFTGGDFLTVSLHVDREGASPGLRGSVSTGCRPEGAAVGSVTPAERPDWVALAESRPGRDVAGARIRGYGRVECARGGAVETWWWDVGGDELLASTEDRCD